MKRIGEPPEYAEQALVVAFIQGAKWWEWYKEGATMWQSDQRLAEEEALKKQKNKTLGKTIYP